MKWPKGAVDYRDFRLRKINTPQFRHLWWLLFWPIYWLRYPLVEWLNGAAADCHVIHCALDDMLPFSEWFIIPYQLWMACLLAMVVYTLLYDVESFKRYSKFLSVAISISTLIFLVYPSCQNLRPTELPRDNILSDAVRWLYAADTNTNVFPSEHAIGAIAVFAAARRTRGLNTPGRLTAIGVLMCVVALSTLFLKQHSVLDVVAAVPVCAVAWFFTYRKKTVDKQPALR